MKEQHELIRCEFCTYCENMYKLANNMYIRGFCNNKNSTKYNNRVKYNEFCPEAKKSS